MARPKNGTTFWDRVWSQISFNDGCLHFNGHKDECGYGRINRNGKLVRLHRAVWEHHNGTIPDKMVICHKCDNPGCINIEHLFVGTQADNVKDMWSKGRANILSGERNGGSKLKAKDIPLIRDRLANGETGYSIARSYGVTGECILHIKNGNSWVNQ